MTSSTETKQGHLTRTILLAAAFFLANQSVEFLVIHALGKSRSEMQARDCQWYAGIIAEGYDPRSKVEEVAPLPPGADERCHAANWAFFPLFPLLARVPREVLGLVPPAAAVWTGKICFFAAIVAFIELFRLYRPHLHPACAATAVSLNPYAFYANTGYTEPLFLLLTCIFFIQLKGNKPILAGGAGALLSATRFVGLSAMAAYATAQGTALWAERKKPDACMLLGLLLIPLGLACFMIFLYARTGDALAFLHVQRAWGRALGDPSEVIATGLAGGPLTRYLALSSLVALAAPLVFLARREFELAVFSWGCTITPLLTGLVSMPRFIWWQAPLLLLAANCLARRRLRLVLLPIFIAGLAYLTRAWLLRADYVT